MHRVGARIDARPHDRLGVEVRRDARPSRRRARRRVRPPRPGQPRPPVRCQSRDRRARCGPRSRRGSRSGACGAQPSRRALLEERCDALLTFGARSCLGDAAGKVWQRERSGGVAHEPLVRCDGLRRTEEERIGHLAHGVVDRVGRDDAMHESIGRGFVGVERAPGGEQLARPARLPPRAARTARSRRAATPAAPPRNRSEPPRPPRRHRRMPRDRPRHRSLLRSPGRRPPWGIGRSSRRQRPSRSCLPGSARRTD